MKLVLGTRGSQLALTQSGHVADALRALGHEVELVTIKTSGDVTAGSLSSLGGTGVFAAALREALLAGTVDFAVHSFKDLPTAPVPGLCIAAVPQRESAADVLCSPRGLRLRDLPPGARVGTGSPRRAAQLKAVRGDLTIVDIRGNVTTRLARADADLDAVVLASAGLHRLCLSDAITEVLDDLLPAPAQGALAVECRADATDILAALSALNDPDTAFAAAAEREILAALGAGCAAPIGARCTRDGDAYRLVARVISADGRRQADVELRSDAGETAPAFGRRAAAALLAAGAAEVTPLDAARASRLEEFHDDRALWAPGSTTELIGRRVFLPRADGPLAAALRDAGAEVTCVPLTRTVPLPHDALEPADWAVFTSPTAVKVLVEQGISPATLAPQLAAVGAATRRALEASGARVDLTPSGESNAEALVAVFPPGSGRVLIPGSALARPVLADGLRALGWQVNTVATYTTQTIADVPPDLTEPWARGDFDAVVITAGSNARAIAELLGAPAPTTKVVAFGRPSAEVAERLGWRVAAVAASQDSAGVIAAIVTQDWSQQ